MAEPQYPQASYPNKPQQPLTYGSTDTLTVSVDLRNADLGEVPSGGSLYGTACVVYTNNSTSEPLIDVKWHPVLRIENDNDFRYGPHILDDQGNKVDVAGLVPFGSLSSSSPSVTLAPGETQTAILNWKVEDSFSINSAPNTTAELAVACLPSFTVDYTKRNVSVHNMGTLAPPTQGTGGLVGRYYNSETPGDNLTFTRTDHQVAFDWGTNSPGGGLTDYWSVVWSGWCEPEYSESYTFTTDSDDGVRLWVDGNLVIDNWTRHSHTLNSSHAISLEKGKKYSIQMQLYEHTGVTVGKLYWSSPSTPQAIIPTSALYPALQPLETA